MPIKGQSPKQVVHTELRKFKHGSLHSGSKRGPLVKNRKQAIAIALSESKKARKKYADGGATTADDMVNEAQQQLAKQKERLPEASTNGLNGWERYKQTGKVDYTPEEIDQGMKTVAPRAFVIKPTLRVPKTFLAAFNGKIRDSFRVPRGDIKIHETSNPSEVVPKGEHKIYDPSDYGFALGGSVGGFNPERGAAFGLAKQGMLHSNVPGRTDKLNLDVPAGSSIVPADVVSALGQGNSLAGNSVLTNMFSKGPFGMNIGKAKGGMRTHQRAASLSKMRFADGGEAKTAPIVAAGGEFVVHPETVANLGNGDLDLGHSILNSFYEQVRENNIKTLRKLPGPKNIK